MVDETVEEFRRSLEWSLSRFRAWDPNDPPSGVSKHEWRRLKRRFMAGCQRLLALPDEVIEASLRDGSVTIH